MVDLLEHAVLVGGLDFWTFDPQRPAKVIQEPRLRDALAPSFHAAGRKLSLEYAFREPPAGDDADPKMSCGIKALEFPAWFVCQNEQCRALVQAHHGLERKADRYVHTSRDCRSGKPTECVPVRFVLACRKGHLDEFPWISFAHRGKSKCASPQLRLIEGATGDFSEVEVRCVCDARQRLSGALAEDAALRCFGQRPWLGGEGHEQCEEAGRLLVRTASNSYFAQVVSALSVPEKSRELEDAVRREWAILQGATAATLPAFRTIPQVKAALGTFSDGDVLAAIDGIKSGNSAPREAIRTAEYRQFVSAGPEKPGDLPRAEDLFFVRRVTDSKLLPERVSRLVLAHKLREVRVQVGFTRLEAASPNLQGEFDVGVESAALGLATDWLPASEVRGEGVFLSFDEEAVCSWEERETVKRRSEELTAGYEAWAQTVGTAPPYPGARYYMLHSLAHLLVTAISLECGYAASAIRERIYCAGANEPLPMAAILLSTGTSGTEGTLGGLVEQGRRIKDHLRRAWDGGKLCSNDPVCAAHTPRRDPTERHLEGAACHGCLFVAECSCERFNKYLDRALVVPSIGHPSDLAFFESRP
jgi:hypothetical protein